MGSISITETKKRSDEEVKILTPLNPITGNRNPAIGDHLLILYKSIGIQIKKNQKNPPPAHQEGCEERSNDPKSKPVPAGLKICLPSILIINLDKTAAAPIKKRVSGSSPNWATSPIINPVIAALGSITSFLSLKYRSSASKETVAMTGDRAWEKTAGMPKDKTPIIYKETKKMIIK